METATPILRLSPQIRHRIQFENIKFISHSNDSAPSRCVHGLLLCYRTIYAEVSTLVYSADIFVLHYWPNRSLQPLLALTAASLAALTTLKIVLNENSCHPGATEEGDAGCCDQDWFTGPSYSRDSKSLEDEIRERCDRDHTRCHRPPLNRNDLRATASSPTALVCDLVCGDPDVVELTVAPLRLLQPLKNCHLRLCRTRNFELQQVAKQVVQDAVLWPWHHAATPLPVFGSIAASTSAPTPSALQKRCSWLLDLPSELRFHILQYTDLVTPEKEVIWGRQDGAHYHESVAHCSTDTFERCDSMDCPPDIHSGCRLRRCWAKHTAVSSTCRCWAPPVSLFMICRTLYEDAQAVFFSCNRFIIHDYKSNQPFKAPPEDGDYPEERLAASQFIREALIFPAYSSRRWPRHDHPAIKDWSSTIDWLKDKINALGLTIRIVMAEPCDGEWPRLRRDMTEAQGREVIAGYAYIIRPLRLLGGGSDDGERGLRAFYAQLELPWKWIPAFKHNWDNPWRTVMGSRYTRLYRTDVVEPRERLWKEWYARPY
ncbi:hypothetical protein B0H63DRAFT_491302 [Podospora didyma]|uniref:Uncharacterized protein n=1 Tax=Podospora didyma TaxID=330526 RepID=A0AAE0P4N9_9PEZI|nr:hypothetical protein B0H63DRAFT_491302 [Podospora didyma]